MADRAAELHGGWLWTRGGGASSLVLRESRAAVIHRLRPTTHLPSTARVGTYNFSRVRTGRCLLSREIGPTAQLFVENLHLESQNRIESQSGLSPFVIG